MASNIEKQLEQLNIKIDKIGEVLLQLIDLLSDVDEQDDNDESKTLDGVLEGAGRNEGQEL